MEELDAVRAYRRSRVTREYNLADAAIAALEARIEDVIAGLTAAVPDEVWSAVPDDLAENHDRYLYNRRRPPHRHGAEGVSRQPTYDELVNMLSFAVWKLRGSNLILSKEIVRRGFSDRFVVRYNDDLLQWEAFFVGHEQIEPVLEGEVIEVIDAARLTAPEQK